ncbi:SDR family oxidoreductase [Deinococcus malanensis]|uniref:SDR family oxidoreductase n=1 Tax=Deinococcus malanensis TaxID=1706855 RepID=UPI00363E6DA0
MRILVVGASSRLGRAVIPHLLARGWEVRAMTRHPSGLGDLAAQGAQVVQGDLRDRRSIERAVQGCTHVLSAAHALSGTGHNSSEAVDLRGISTLIDAAAHAQVEHFVFTSAWGSSSESPVDFMRYKAAGERYLRGSGLSWTILRPAAFMEFWATLMWEPVVRGRPVMLFGRGQNPINYVAVQDVAFLSWLPWRTRPLVDASSTWEVPRIFHFGKSCGCSSGHQENRRA